MIAAVKIDIKQQEIKKKENLYYTNFRKGTFYQNLKHNVKQTFKLDLILVGIPSSLILSVKNRGWGSLNR